MWESLVAVAVALVGVAITAAWFGVARRRRAEAEIGVQSLASMKWRDCVALLLEALRRDGYQPLPEPIGSGGDGGSEFLLAHGGEKVLLGYKHGTAYRLGEASIGEFVNGMHLHGTRSGLLITLGSVEGRAREMAATWNVKLEDGAALWAKLRQLVPPAMLRQVRDEASARTRKGLWAGVAVSLAAGLAIHLYAGGILLPESAVAVEPAPATPAAAFTRVARPENEALVRRLNATAQAMAEVAKLSPEELAQRRVEAARLVSALPQVDAATWSAPRTLLLTLNRTDGKDAALIEETCRIVVSHEELRYTRIQLDPPAGSEQSVRWRLCG